MQEDLPVRHLVDLIVTFKGWIELVVYHPDRFQCQHTFSWTVWRCHVSGVGLAKIRAIVDG